MVLLWFLVIGVFILVIAVAGGMYLTHERNKKAREGMSKRNSV